MRWFSIFICLCFSPSSAVAASVFAGDVMVPELHPTGYSENGNLKGLAVEVIREVNKRAGNRPLNLQLVPYVRAKRVLEAGNSVIIASMARTPDLEDKYIWLYKLFDAKRFYVTRKGDAKLNHTQAKSVNLIGVLRNSSFEKALKSAGNTNISAVKDERTNLRMLVAGRINAWYTSNILLSGALLGESSIGRDQITIGDIVSPNIPVYAAASRDVPSVLIGRWQDAYASMKRDGTLSKMQQKYSLQGDAEDLF
ncbi:MAG: transporter substrate-binding domain-containing protein [Pseudomonas marincola]